MNSENLKKLKRVKKVNIDVLIAIVVNLLLILKLEVGLLKMLMILVIFNIINVSLVYKRYYQFAYNSRVIKIFHPWFSSMNVQFDIGEIRRIEFVKLPFNGKGILVHLKTGIKKTFGANTINSNSLEMMVEEISKSINK